MVSTDDGAQKKKTILKIPLPKVCRKANIFFSLHLLYFNKFILQDDDKKKANVEKRVQPSRDIVPSKEMRSPFYDRFVNPAPQRKSPFAIKLYKYVTEVEEDPL